MNQFKAIAAMSENRVIGAANRIPWHLPEDLEFFKRLTTGQIIVMGRNTFESIGKPLPNRTTIVLTHSHSEIPGVRTISSLALIHPETEQQQVFICGGAQVYAQTLLQCSDLYLTRVKRWVDGDRFFPRFEDHFEVVEVILDRPEFQIAHYRNCLTSPPSYPAEVDLR